MILGVVGRKGAGKDTFAQYVKHFNRKTEILHYADRLKEACDAVFPVGKLAFWHPVQKELPLREPIYIDEYLNQLQAELGVKLPALGYVATTGRNLLQYVGTEYVRHHHGEYWTEYLRDKMAAVEKKNRFILVPDVRFENEANTVTDFSDGLLLRIHRPAQLRAENEHASEAQQDNITCPTLHVGENDFLMSEMIAYFFAKGCFAEAFDFVERSATRRPLDLSATETLLSQASA